MVHSDTTHWSLSPPLRTVSSFFLHPVLPSHHTSDASHLFPRYVYMIGRLSKREGNSFFPEVCFRRDNVDSDYQECCEKDLLASYSFDHGGTPRQTSPSELPHRHAARVSEDRKQSSAKRGWLPHCGPWLVT